jgi:hypothetical protein
VLAILGKDNRLRMKEAVACSHCGGFGWYVYRVICEDRRERPIGSDCLRFLPRHPIAEASQHIWDYLRDRNRVSRKPSKWMVEVLDAAERFARGELDEDAAWERIDAAQARDRRLDWTRDWIDARYG